MVKQSSCTLRALVENFSEKFCDAPYFVEGAKVNFLGFTYSEVNTNNKRYAVMSMRLLQTCGKREVEVTLPLHEFTKHYSFRFSGLRGELDLVDNIEKALNIVQSFFKNCRIVRFDALGSQTLINFE
jgi:hypothetical protein